MQRRDVLKQLSILLGGGLSVACERALAVPAPDRRVVPTAYANYARAEQDIAYRVADLIIPATDTPGAIDAGVGPFIDYVVSVWYEDDEQSRFIQGLTGLEASANQQFNTSFTALTQSQQVLLLQQIEASEPAGDMTLPFGAGNFFAQIKELTVAGFYTSEIGATEERKYVPMPGRFDGYHKFSEVGRQWSS